MKTFLNRRPAAQMSGTSRLVAVVRGATAAHEAQSQDSREPRAAEAPESIADFEARADHGASGATAEPRPAASPVSTLHAVPVMPAHLNGRPVQIAEGAAFEALDAEKELATFRTYRSFGYTVTMYFHAHSLGFFVALHQDGALWRALKANDIDAAGSAFHLLQEQATRLADSEARRIQLVAQNAELARMIEESEAQAERLRVDLQRHAHQENVVSGRQHQVRKEVAQLEAQRIAAQAQLNKAHRSIHQLKVASNEGVPRMSGR
ncbi:DUF2968 domain-containing protein [Paraburkholderia acidisoli]|uniref:DUF2968 domain-containing protein n=1 Tax=Paraburkholderia acidisoli TaxID=2571748 RepID=A0A7Z2GLW2_9BURK|nr:DUF2968 domain-containing protein [Paraburkholderia acidisoli]